MELKEVTIVITPRKIDSVSKIIESTGINVLDLASKSLLSIVKKNFDIAVLHNLKIYNKVELDNQSVFDTPVSSNKYRFWSRRERSSKYIISRNGKILLELNKVEFAINLRIIGPTLTDILKFENTIKKKLVNEKVKVIEKSNSEIVKLRELKYLKENKDSEILKNISKESIKYLLNDRLRKKILKMRKSRYSMITPDKKDVWLGYKELDKLKSHGFLDERFALKCKRCNKLGSNFENENQAIEESKKSNCSDCGNHFNGRIKIYQISRLGEHCLKGGSWFEAYVRQLLIKNGVNPDNIKIHAYKDRKEFDVVFVHQGELVLLECKDTKVKTTDVDIFVPKAQRLEDIDYAYILTTTKLSKDVKNYVSEISEDKDFILDSINNFKNIEKEIKRIISNLNDDKKNAESAIIERIRANTSEKIGYVRFSTEKRRQRLINLRSRM